MAVSVPEDPRWSVDASPAERQLWRWAVEQLPERIRVLPQVAMTVPDRGAPREAELDLVLVDPDHGVTVVEVKGGRMHYDARHARWLQNGRECRDPVQQAKRGRSILRALLESKRIDPATVALRWAVATPECELQAPEGGVLPRRQLWDARAGQRLATDLPLVQGALTGGERPLGERQADRIVDVLRGRSVEGRLSLAAAIDRHEHAVRVHTESHRNVLHRLSVARQVLVTGPAGTGKTVLAIEAAVRAAAMGDRVLLACWTVVLGGWLRQAVRRRLEELGSPLAEEVTDDLSGRIVVGDLASLALGDRSVDDVAREHTGDRRQFFYRQLPEQLHPGAAGGEFDMVVLDEAQDLSEEWVLAIASLVARGGRWFAFADPAQDLFDLESALPDFLGLPGELRENFRNTRPIAEFVGRFGPVETDCVATGGEPVRFVACDADEVVATVEEVGAGLLRHGVAEADLALLTLFHNPARRRSAALADAIAAGEVVRTNGAAFKGMERPVVVLGLDVDPDRRDPDEVRRAVYAAASRARSLLTVVGDPAALRELGLQELAGDLAS